MPDSVWVDGKDLLKMTDMGLNRYRLSSVGLPLAAKWP